MHPAARPGSPTETSHTGPRTTRKRAWARLGKAGAAKEVEPHHGVSFRLRQFLTAVNKSSFPPFHAPEAYPRTCLCSAQKMSLLIFDSQYCTDAVGVNYPPLISVGWRVFGRVDIEQAVCC